MLFSFLLFSTLSNAQIYKGLGIKLGTSIANQRLSMGTLWGGSVHKYGLTFGIFKVTHLFEKLNLVTGINYSQKGANDEIFYMDDFGHNKGIQTLKKEANFITLEILGKYGGGADKLSPYILAGARMDIFISGKNTFDIDPTFLKYYQYPVSNNKTFGGTIGFGLDYKPSKFLTLFIEGTYNPDLTNLGEKETNYGYNYTVKNYSFDIRTGIKF